MLSASFAFGIFFYHQASNRLIEEHLMSDMKTSINGLSYALEEDIRHNRLEAFKCTFENYKMTNDTLGAVYVLDKSMKILFSTAEYRINSRFSGTVKDVSVFNKSDLKQGISPYAVVHIKTSVRPETYYLIVVPAEGNLQNSLVKSLHTIMFAFTLFVAFLLGIVLTITQKIIVKPLNMMVCYTENRTDLPERFCLKEFDELRKAMKGYISSLLAQQEYTRTILDSQDDMVIISSGERLMDANKAFLDFMDINTVEDFNEQYDCLCNLFEDCDNPNFLRRYDTSRIEWINLILENPLFRYRVKITRNGQTMIFRINAGKMAQKDCESYVIVLSDVTIEEKYKENLEIWVNDEISKRTKSEEKYQYLFNSLIEGVCIHSFDENNFPTEFIEVNDRMCTLFGYSHEEFLKMKPMSLHKPEALEGLGAFASKIHEDGYLEFETELLKKDGTVVVCELYSKLMDFYGQKTVFTSIKDVTDKKLIECQMIESERMLIQQAKLSTLGEMLGSISHQWKQPLNAIALISDILKDELSEKEGMSESITTLDKINEQIHFMAHTIDDFRNFYKPSKEAIVFSVSAVISEIYNMLKPQYNTSGMIVYILKDETLDDRVEGFPSEFKQVVMNLLSNTKDVLDERKLKPEFKGRVFGDVSIKISRTDDKVWIQYCDAGGGIDEKIMQRMFNTSKGSSGDGIGMHISQQIIENMGGKIAVENTDRGVCFMIVLSAMQKKFSN